VVKEGLDDPARGTEISVTHIHVEPNESILRHQHFQAGVATFPTFSESLPSLFRSRRKRARQVHEKTLCPAHINQSHSYL
jgi:hypothetical protein